VDQTNAALRHKNFYRELDAILRGIDEGQGLESMLTSLLSQIGAQVLSEETGISSGRLYRRDGQDYVVVRSFGARGREILGTRIPARYQVFDDLDTTSVTYVFPDDSRYDHEIEAQLGVHTFAAFALDENKEYVAAFGIDDGAEVNEVMLTLNALRYAIAHRVRDLSIAGQLREARDIQISLLPPDSPPFQGYELAGRSRPAEEVGGDIFDFLPLDEHLMGIAVGDASGHGLPAALQARDVVTGLRMGVEKDLKITSVVRRLNRVIHRSGLTSRFVSLFYGEIERSGNFVYVNAGHDPGLVLRTDGTTEELGSTGIVMGPLAEAQYRRDMVRLWPGDLVLLYTDGITERLQPETGEEFGPARLEATVRLALASGRAVAELPDLVLDQLFVWGGRLPWADDVTLVVAQRKV
jgi:phosphoserine phosphatase RsbU/P